MKKSKTFLVIFIFYVLICMVLFPAILIKQTFNGISAWAINVLPSVLPFIFFVKILNSFGVFEKLSAVFRKPCKTLFNTPPESALVFLTSIISGYPVGAKMTADLYLSGKIKKSDAFKMCSFCSTSGPMFIIGAVGISMLKNATFGYIIFVSHILGALINGLLYRKLTVKDDGFFTSNGDSKKESFDLSNVVLDSALSMIIIGTIIAIFFVIIASLSPILNIFPSQISSILEGFVEITKGCLDIATSYKNIFSVVACSFVISFGGISTILQSSAMLSKLNMPISLFCLQKITHAIISTLISVVIVIIL